MRRVVRWWMVHDDGLLHNVRLTEVVGGAVEDRLASGDLIEDREGAERESSVGRGAGAHLLWDDQERTRSEYQQHDHRKGSLHGRRLQESGHSPPLARRLARPFAPR